MSVPTKRSDERSVEAWFEWARPPEAYTVGAEEELMLLHPPGWALAQTVETVLPSLPPRLARHVEGETHGSVLEIASEPQVEVAGVEEDLRTLRRQLAEALQPMGLRVAS